MADADPRFRRALAFVLDVEGGYAHDPVDRGGPTCRGVTQASYSSWRRRHGLLPRPVRDCTAEETTALYEECFWRPAGCGRLPEMLALATFDGAVQHGPRRAVRMLQRALGVSDDGFCGPATILAADRAREQGRMRGVLRRYLVARARFYVTLWLTDPSQRKYRKGWVRRLRRLRAACREIA